MSSLLASRSALVGLFVLAALVRVGVLFVTRPVNLGANTAQLYIPAAHRIVAGLGFNDPGTREFLMACPGYAYFLAGLFHLFGDNLFIARLVGALLDAVVPVLVLLLGAPVVGRRASLVAAVAYALYPVAVHYSLQVTCEGLFTFLQTAGVAALLVATRRLEIRWSLLAGVLFGAAVFVRSTPLLLPVALLPVIAGAGRWKPRAWICGTVMAVIPLLVACGWGIRNQAVLGEFVPTQTSSGSTLFCGADERLWTINGRQRYYLGLVHSLAARGIPKPTSGLERDIDRWFWRLGIERYRIRWSESPLGTVGFMGHKFIRQWYSTEAGHSSKPLALINLPLFALLIAGWFARRRAFESGDLILTGIIVYYLAIGVLFHPMIRYLYPATPFVLIYAAVGALWLVRRWLPADAGEPAPAGP